MDTSMTRRAGEPASKDWRNSAACLEEDPELFHPVGTTGPALLQISSAKAVCAGCPVLDECRGWALDTKEPNGIFGGLTADERESMRRRGARARRAGVAA